MGPHASIGQSSAWPDTSQGPGLSLFVAKIAVVAQVKVGDGRGGLQKYGNVLAKTKHDLATLQFGAFVDEEMPI